jgi:hypothetical protein
MAIEWHSRKPPPISQDGDVEETAEVVSTDIVK